MSWLKEQIARLRGHSVKADGVPKGLPSIQKVTREIEGVRVFKRSKDAYDRGLVGDTSLQATLGAEKYRGPKYHALRKALGKPTREYDCDDPTCQFQDDFETYLDEWIVLVRDPKSERELHQGTIYFRRDDEEPGVTSGRWNIGAQDKRAGGVIKREIQRLMRKHAGEAKAPAKAKAKTKSKAKTKAKRSTKKTEVTVTMKVPATDAKAVRQEIRALRKKYTGR